MSDEPLPQAGGSYLRDAETGALTPVFVPTEPPPPVYEEPTAPDPDAVEIASPTTGGAYLADPATGDLTPLFQPDTGMDPDYVTQADQAVPDAPAEAVNAEIAAEPIPETPAPDAGEEESPK